jgi:hypothetical protein
VGEESHRARAAVRCRIATWAKITDVERYYLTVAEQLEAPKLDQQTVLHAHNRAITELEKENPKASRTDLDGQLISGLLERMEGNLRSKLPNGQARKNFLLKTAKLLVGILLGKGNVPVAVPDCDDD